jgi:tetratricopeptide (TPR) repeat protein
LQDLEAAMGDFNLAISLNSQDYRAYFNRGCACGRNGDNSGALRDFSQVIRLKPSYALAYVNRAVARHRLGYHQGAIADLQIASQYFEHEGEKLAYDRTLDLLNTIKQQIPPEIEVA